MGDITEKRRRNYSGLDADKATIPAGGKSVHDTYFATDVKILYFWDSVAWIIIPLDVIVAGMIQTDAVETLKIKALNVTPAKASLGFGRFVERLRAAEDFVAGNFTSDGTWKVDGLDLSGIVPAGAFAVKLRVKVTDDAADSELVFRRDATNVYNDLSAKTHVANIAVTRVEDVSIDSNRLLDYKGSNLVWTAISVTVIGWYI